jgi:hypothetical protein
MAAESDVNEEFTRIEKIRSMQKQFEEVAEKLGEVRKLMAADEGTKIKLVVDKASFYLEYIHGWAQQLPAKCTMKIAQAKRDASRKQKAMERASSLASKRRTKSS